MPNVLKTELYSFKDGLIDKKIMWEISCFFFYNFEQKKY